MKPKVHEHGFRIAEFENRGGSKSWRVCGWLRGKRFRENFGSLKAAEARRLELEGERLGQQSPEVLRATWLSGEQLKSAEWAVFRMPDPDELRRAVEFWQRSGRAQSKATEHAAGMRLDDAVAAFEKHLDGAVDLREASRRNLRYRVRMFASEVGDVRLEDVTPERMESWLDSRKASAVTRDNDRRAIARFFAWCVERPQRFLVANPVREVRVAKPERGEPQIYPLRTVMRILAAARRFRGGRFLKFVVLQLFGGLRPTEALRFRDDQLVDGHVRIEGRQSKTGRARTIEADPVLLAWLRLCPDGPASDPQKSKLLWGELKRLARIKTWIPDGLRHTALSHLFRRCGSFGLVAEHAGNSESVIREHYQAKTTAAESEAFWRLFPTRAERQRAREASGAVVAFPTASPKSGRKARRA